ncbi:hypothetical protein NEMBOFW57_004527 [Staphylotrichum longicolle]|uniref:MutL C-terminal dimerisation domain-containing protein n=1 Tax=Staphylotrichum longicolle TaxID=669026 RepID=A0AAD4I0J7_9PEZI|nr:hypothetical protein NEMBOFW57_004527 [Staphylotrichum longicolle]
MLSTLEGRIPKTALQKAHVLAQVDRKFILVQLVTEPPASSSRGFESDDLLVLIDQHAADERCKVEDLFKSYFTADPTGTGQLLAHTQTLDKPLHFDLASQDGELLVRFKSHFAHWGILYGIQQEKDKLRKGVTVDVHTYWNGAASNRGFSWTCSGKRFGSFTPKEVSECWVYRA